MRIRLAAIGAMLVVITTTAFAQNPTPTQQTTPDTIPDCENPGSSYACGDQRSSFLASAYLGEAIDSFASDEQIQYLNPQAANSSRQRAVAGVDFEYRLIGKRTDPKQLWIYGETVYGVRSKDVDCKSANNVKLSVCSDNLGTTSTASVLAGAPDQFIAILRNASTLEAFVGARYETKLLQSSTDSPARVYVNLQLGFLDVTGGGGDAINMHHLGVGATAVNGMFQQSFLEVGIGKDDLFQRHRNRRLIIDGYLTVDPHYIPGFLNRVQAGSRIRPFVELTGDFDGGHGSDSVQTYFGLNFNFDYFRGNR